MRIKRLIGNATLWQREKTLFLCSKRTPYSWYATIFAWAERLTPDDCVMCVPTTELEAELFKALLVQGVPTVLAVMDRFRMPCDLQMMRAMEEDRLLVVVLERDEPRGRGQTARLRNEFMLGEAARVVCGYVNKNGSVFPIVAVRPGVTYLQPTSATMVADAATHRRWSLWEDKTLLRMFYADMGLHAIHKETKRPYVSVRARIHALTMPAEVLMGREFEEWVLEAFRALKGRPYVLKEWRGDKVTTDEFPEGNRYPDFVFERKKKAVPTGAAGGCSPILAIECKWRRAIPTDWASETFPQDRLDVYRQFSAERAMPVYVVLGIGGEPSEPESLFVIPLTDIPALVSGQAALKKFQTPCPDLN